MRVLNAAKNDPELREVIELSYEMDAEERDANQILPMQALAANEETNRCAILCELYVLSQYGVSRTLEDWDRQAKQQGWFKDGGTPIHNIGRLLEQECFSICRTFHNSLDDLKKALVHGKVIVVVDGKEMTTNIEKLNKERLEDDFIGANPNHAIVINEIENERVLYYDPELKKETSISVELFMDAWNDSSHYMVSVYPRDFSKYEPHPIDLSDVDLPEELMELREAIAENAHEVWAQGRKEQGWTYGSERNDALKQTPDMIPYSDLTDEEKFFDREMAMNTIKLLKKLGYNITHEDSK
jgi:hypothetical protein